MAGATKTYNVDCTKLGLLHIPHWIISSGGNYMCKTGNVLAKNLSAIPQLLGPQNCCTMLQNHALYEVQNKKIGGHASRPRTQL